MKQEDCKRLERKQNGMQVILEFPRKPENEEDIKRKAHCLIRIVRPFA